MWCSGSSNAQGRDPKYNSLTRPYPNHTPQAPTPGKSLKVTYALSNKSGQNVQSSAVAIMLPGDVMYTKSSSRPMGAAGTLTGSDVVWANGGAIHAGKSKTYMAEMRVRPRVCVCVMCVRLGRSTVVHAPCHSPRDTHRHRGRAP